MTTEAITPLRQRMIEDTPCEGGSREGVIAGTHRPWSWPPPTRVDVVQAVAHRTELGWEGVRPVDGPPYGPLPPGRRHEACSAPR
jgi:hypothetical protein